MKSLILFIVGGLAFGAAALGIGYCFAEQEALIQGGAALGLTFVPAIGTLGWVLYSYRTNPEMQLLACLGCSGVRMGIALGGAYFLRNSQPQQFDDAVLYWLILFYLTFLVIEITLVVWQQPTPASSTQA